MLAGKNYGYACVVYNLFCISLDTRLYTRNFTVLTNCIARLSIGAPSWFHIPEYNPQGGSTHRLKEVNKDGVRISPEPMPRPCLPPFVHVSRGRAPE